MRKLFEKFNNANERIAVSATKIFGSMPAFWVCFVWAILPLFKSLANEKDFILYVSAGIIQLIALPLIMVGTSVLNASTERRAAEDHEMIMSEMQILKEMHQDSKDQIKELMKIQEELVNALTNEESQGILLNEILKKLS